MIIIENFRFVTFTSEDAVNEAISQLNGFPAGDFILKVSKARGRSTASQDSVNFSGNRTEGTSPTQTNEFPSQFVTRPPNFPMVNGMPMSNGVGGQSGHCYSRPQMAPPQTVTQSDMINQNQRDLQSGPGRNFMNTAPTSMQPSTNSYPPSTGIKAK